MINKWLCFNLPPGISPDMFRIYNLDTYITIEQLLFHAIVDSTDYIRLRPPTLFTQDYFRQKLEGISLKNEIYMGALTHAYEHGNDVDSPEGKRELQIFIQNLWPIYIKMCEYYVGILYNLYNDSLIMTPQKTYSVYLAWTTYTEFMLIIADDIVGDVPRTDIPIGQLNYVGEWV